MHSLCWSAENNHKSSRIFFMFFLSFSVCGAIAAVPFLPNSKSFISGPLIKLNVNLQLNVTIVYIARWKWEQLDLYTYMYYSYERVHNFSVESCAQMRKNNVFMQTKCSHFAIARLSQTLCSKVFLVTLINEFLFSFSLKSPAPSNVSVKLKFSSNMYCTVLWLITSLK